MSMDDSFLSSIIYDLTSSKTDNVAKYKSLNKIDSLLIDRQQQCSSESILSSSDTLWDNLSATLSLLMVQLLDRCNALIKTHSGVGADNTDTSAALDLLLAMCNTIQGIVLVRKASQVCFSAKAVFEALLDALAICSHALKKDAAKESDERTSHQREHSQQTQKGNAPMPSNAVKLAAAILDTLLALMVDNVPAIRSFEAEGGLEVAVHVLKRKKLHQDVRIKALELLYFYLLPEDGASNPELTSQGSEQFLADIAADFSYMPSTPQKATLRSYQGKGVGKDVMQNATKNDALQLAEISGNEGSNANIQRTPSNRTLEILAGQRRASRSNLSPTKTSSFKTPRNMTELSISSHSPKSGRSLTEPVSQVSWTPRKASDVILPVPDLNAVRSVNQKKQILGQWLGNVDLLVSGMESAGVWKGLVGASAVVVG